MKPLGAIAISVALILTGYGLSKTEKPVVQAPASPQPVETTPVKTSPDVIQPQAVQPQPDYDRLFKSFDPIHGRIGEVVVEVEGKPVAGRINPAFPGQTYDGVCSLNHRWVSLRITVQSHRLVPIGCDTLADPTEDRS